MRRYLYPLLLSLILLSLAGGTYTNLAQESREAARERVIETIKSHARSDAEIDRPAQAPQDMQMLFGEDASSVGLSLQDVASIYDEAYKKAKDQKPWYELVQPNIGWIAAVLMFFLLLFRDIVKESLTSVINAARKRIYVKVAGHRIVRRTALRHYRLALIKKYKEIKIPFRPDRPLKMREIYVPLKVKGSNDQEQIDSSRVLVSYKKLMVVGPPGSGKSMLLKHIVLSYAQEQSELVTEEVVPILLELNRLNEQDRAIEDHLTDILSLNDFPNAWNFVDSSLESGALMLLFDGLDEVNSNKRNEVVKKIKDLLDTYENCPVIITCRNAVYRNEFADTVDQTMEIIEFSDQQIQTFLGAWQQYMPPDKSIEQLILTLRERPRIMALARNPLLLTIIAYLYIDTEFVLPHSRAEFYDQAVDILLRQWKGESNLFKAPVKRLVLQHLALFNQDKSVEGDRDRRSIDLKTIMEEIKRVLPSLNLENERATPLLEEIIERSGLLLSIDAGARYQFAHLTLQEFFAASALRDDADGLLERFSNDRDAWRETIKLWCGLDHDSTRIIEEIYKLDPVTAFECLADAQKLSPSVANEIIGYFRDKLIFVDDSNDAVIQAFAAVASGPSARAKEVFNFLTEMLSSDVSDAKAKAAAISLSLTNQPVAVDSLIRYYPLKFFVSKALVRMGDLAVPALIETAKNGQPYSYDALLDLMEIGTPYAARSIVPLLWSNDALVSIIAALVLGSMLPSLGVEDALRNYPDDLEEQTAKSFRWVWAPFDEPPGSSLPKIAAQIAYRINQSDLGDGFNLLRLDPRIAIPLAVHEVKELSRNPINTMGGFFGLIPLGVDRFVTGMDTLDASSHRDDEETILLKLRQIRVRLAERFNKAGDPKSLLELLSYIDPKTQLILSSRLLRDPLPTITHWQNQFRPLIYDFDKSWHLRLILLILGMVSLAGVLGIGDLLNEASDWLTKSFLGLSLTYILICWFIGLLKGPSAKELYVATSLVLLLPLKYIANTLNGRAMGSGIKDYDSTKFFIPFIPLVAFFGTYKMLKNFSPFSVITIWISLIAAGWLLTIIGLQKKARAENPLHGILNLDARD